MHLIAIKDLKQPRLLKQRLLTEKELLLTSDGRPVAVLVDIGPSEDPERVIQAVRDARSRMALSLVRDVARGAGTSVLTAQAIDREIASARKARKARR